MTFYNCKGTVSAWLVINSNRLPSVVFNLFRILTWQSCNSKIQTFVRTNAEKNRETSINVGFTVGVGIDIWEIKLWVTLGMTLGWYFTECFHSATRLVSNVRQGIIIKSNVFANRQKYKPPGNTSVFVATSFYSVCFGTIGCL